MFAKEQPDLNWENPVVRQKIYEMVNWWLDKGVAGFRIDAIINIKKDINFPSFEPDGPDGLATCIKMVEAVNGVGDFLEELKHETFEKHDAFTVGEVFNMKEDELLEFIGEDGHFSTMFDFSAHVLTFGEHGWYDQKPLRFEEWRKVIFDSQQELQGKCFKANIIENHDEPRGATHYLPEHARNDAGKKMLGTVSVLLRGIPFIYQGQEIGMTNCKRNDISEYDDISTIDQYQEALRAGLSEEEALKCCYENSRDNARTPMQWSDGKNGGFTDGTPWLAMNPNYMEINVAAQEHKADSVLAYYRKLIALRKAKEYKDTFTYGIFKPEYENEDEIFAFERVNEESGQRLLILANFGTEEHTITLEQRIAKVLLTNEGRQEAINAEAALNGTITLDSCETVVLELEK